MICEKENPKYVCIQCNNQEFSTQGNLTRHNKEKHNQNVTSSTYGCSYEGCNASFSKKTALTKHNESIHKVKLRTHIVQFDSEELWLNWKHDIEEKHKSKFVKTRGDKRKPNGSTTAYYDCYRSGKYVPKGANKRRHKVDGTNKIGRRCPAAMTVVRRNDTFLVSYQSVHVGHPTEPTDGAELLSETPKTNAWSGQLLVIIPNAMPSSNVRFRRIAPKIDVNDDDSSSLKVAETQHSAAVDHSAITFDSDDARAVAVLIEKLKHEEENSILFFKPIGESLHLYGHTFKTIEFALAIMTDAQRTNLQLYGSKGVYLDTTHGTRLYKYQLSTLMVIDSNDEGFPCAFFYHEREDRKAFEVFFEAIKERLRHDCRLDPSVYVADDFDGFYDAWVDVFGPVERKLCTPHVESNWNKKLRSLRLPEDKQVIVKSELNKFNSEIDVQSFELRIARTVQCWSNDESLMDFAKYFRDTYLERKEQWARCYRVGLQIADTDTVVANWHRRLKVHKFEFKKLGRMEKSISAAMKSLREKLSGKGESVKNVRMVRRHHDESLIMDASIVTKANSTTYAVLASETPKGETCPFIIGYEVVLVDASCTCDFRCVECDICVHSFKCNCSDYTVCHNVCAHIHLVARVPHRPDRLPRDDAAHEAMSDLQVAADGAVVNGSGVGQVDATNANHEQCRMSADRTGMNDELKMRLIEKVQSVVDVIRKSSTRRELQVIAGCVDALESSLADVGTGQFNKLF